MRLQRPSRGVVSGYARGMDFEAPPSNAASWIPALFLVAVLPLFAVFPLLGEAPVWASVLHVATIVGLVALLLWVWRLIRRPMRYRIEGGALLVPGHLGVVRVPLTTATWTVGTVSGHRVAGTAIPPFLLGTFADREGMFHMAATATDGVWVRGDTASRKQRVFVTPADIPGFGAALVAAGARGRDEQGHEIR